MSKFVICTYDQTKADSVFPPPETKSVCLSNVSNYNFSILVSRISSKSIKFFLIEFLSLYRSQWIYLMFIFC